MPKTGVKTVGGRESSVSGSSSACGSTADGSTDVEDQEDEGMSGASSSSCGSEQGEGEAMQDGGDDAIDDLFSELMTEDIHEGGAEASGAGVVGTDVEEDLFMVFSGAIGFQPSTGADAVSSHTAEIAL